MRPLAAITPSSHLMPTPQAESIQETFHELGHWHALAQSVKHEFKSMRLETLDQLNQLICGRISSSKSFSSEELGFAKQMILRFSDAKAQADFNIEELESEFGDFSSKALLQMQQLEDSGAEGLPLVKYGGSLGHAIFTEMTGNIVVPELKSLFVKFSGETQHLSYDDKLAAMEAFLPAFFTLAGAERGTIAKWTATEQFEMFGAYQAQNISSNIEVLHNPQEPAWKAWKELITNKISEILTQAAREFRDSHKDKSSTDFLPRKFEHWERFEPRAVSIWKEGNLALKLESAYWGTSGSLFNDSPEGLQRVRYGFSWLHRQDQNNATDCPIELTGLKCFHLGPDFKTESMLAPEVLEALLSKDPQQLRDRIASILHGFPQTSTFPRGQASITQMMVESIAACHGYRVTYSPEWTVPNPTPDMRAMTELDRNKFIEVARGHIFLSKIDV